MRKHGVGAAWTLVALALAPPAGAQDVPSPPGADKKPGLFHLGPFYLTPRLNLGPIGLDTNVFYTATDRRTDMSGSGGPALDMVVPIRRSLQLLSSGGINYVYFVRTVDQRRLVGNASTSLLWTRPRTSAGVSARYDQTYARPEREVDRRLEQIHKEVRVNARRSLFGRTQLALTASVNRVETPEQIFLGTNLQRTLTYDTYTGISALEYALTPKSRLALEGAYETTRFSLDPTRDADVPRLSAGVRTDSAALISGEAMVGVRWYRPRSLDAPRQHALYANVDATWHISPRTRIGGGYSTDLTYTSFEVVSGAPVLHQETINARVQKEIVRNLDIQLAGQRLHTRTENAVKLTLPSGVVEAVRDDTSYETSADLGYRFWSRLRIGAKVMYASRRSTFTDFGVEGLLVGATVVYTP
jgi:hypothetical protein